MCFPIRSLAFLLLVLSLPRPSSGEPSATTASADRPEPVTSWAYPPVMPGARTEVYRKVGETELQAWIFEPAGHQVAEDLVADAAPLAAGADDRDRAR